MVALLRKAYYLISILLVLILAFASIVNTNWLTSTVYVVLYLIFALFTLISVVFIPGVLTKLLHLILGLLILTSVYVKAVNDRYPLTMGEGGTYLLSTGTDTLALELIDFSITYEQGSATAVQYESRIRVNGSETVAVTVNHPYKFKTMRLYQSSYKTVAPFTFYLSDTLTMFEGQTARFEDRSFNFIEYDPYLNRAAVRYNDILFYLPVAERTEFLGRNLLILPGDPVMATVLEYVEMKGHGLLTGIATAFLLLLAWIMVRRYLWK